MEGEHLSGVHELFLGNERDGGATGEVIFDVHSDLGSVSLETISLCACTANG